MPHLMSYVRKSPLDSFSGELNGGVFFYLIPKYPLKISVLAITPVSKALLCLRGIRARFYDLNLNYPRVATSHWIVRSMANTKGNEDPDFVIGSSEEEEASQGEEEVDLEPEGSSSPPPPESSEASEDSVVLEGRSKAKKRRMSLKSQGGASQAAAEPLVVPDLEDCLFEGAKELPRLQKALLEWYDANHRVLPWRRNVYSQLGKDKVEEYRKQGLVGAPLDLPDDDFIYYVWVCEIMSQQTQVSRVCEYFTRWIKKWPTVGDLAKATQDEVNEMWAGLGYYRRARYLLEGAKYVVDDLDGKFPRHAKELQKIPGIGAYTSCAIASTACGEQVAVVDGNVVRVLSRLRKIAGDPKNTGMVKLFADLAQKTLDHERPGDFNQSLMELGATVCIPNGKPACEICPVSDLCKARSSGVPVTDYPSKSVKAQKREERVGITVLRIIEDPKEKITKTSGKFLLVKRPAGGLLAGLWEFPLQHVDASASTKEIQSILDSYLTETIQLPYLSSEAIRVMERNQLGEAVHVFSHIRMTMVIEELCLAGPVPESSPEGVEMQWITYEELSKKGLSSGVKKVLKAYDGAKKKRANSIAKFFHKK